MRQTGARRAADELEEGENSAVDLLQLASDLLQLLA